MAEAMEDGLIGGGCFRLAAKYDCRGKQGVGATGDPDKAPSERVHGSLYMRFGGDVRKQSHGTSLWKIGTGVPMLRAPRPMVKAYERLGP
jgi:hypothetical protein